MIFNLVQFVQAAKDAGIITSPVESQNLLALARLLSQVREHVIGEAVAVCRHEAEMAHQEYRHSKETSERHTSTASTWPSASATRCAISRIRKIRMTLSSNTYRKPKAAKATRIKKHKSRDKPEPTERKARVKIKLLKRNKDDH